ncbi:MAG: sulfite exporter TauE/SafE family protein [Maribacter sp.]|nr:sulfite exporter TauE/SafE family protein [Maribacter sp.]NND79808.1 sulfite exporter TauE/SafE family protein [Maribacter sp.]
MLLSIENLILLCLGFFVIATLYSSVGFGGGSSYLALLTLFLFSFFAIRSLALVCNIVVVSGSTYLYFKHGHARFKDFLPFIVTSIPMAFLGATFRLKEEVFFIILGGALIISSIFLIWQTAGIKLTEPTKTYPKYISYMIGGAIGLLSGLVGIGGGIFLAPVLNHINWDRSVKIAALASFFILVNSISGLGGLILAGTLELPWIETLVLGMTVLIGGQLGVRLSLKKLSAKGIKRITAILVFVVGVRVLLVNGMNIL